MEPTEEDDADDVDHEVDESSKRRDDEDPYAPDAGDAGKETLRMMTMKSTMQLPASLARRCQRDPSCSYKRQAKTPCNQQLYICVDYMLVF